MRGKEGRKVVIHGRRLWEYGRAVRFAKKGVEEDVFSGRGIFFDVVVVGL